MERVKTEFKTSRDGNFERDAIVVHRDYITSVDLMDTYGGVIARMNIFETKNDVSVDIIPIHPRMYIEVKSWHEGTPTLHKILNLKDLICVLLRKTT